MSKVARKMQKLRKADATARHVRIYRWELESPAYRSLSLFARCLMVELKALYNGTNNGDLFLSVTDAARKLNTGRRQAMAAFRELVDRGFIKPRQRGAFQWKQRTATCWLLTEYDCDVTGHGPTKDFMKWRPESEQNRTENKTRYPLRHQTGTPEAPDSREIELSGTPEAPDSAKIATHTGAPEDTQIICQGIGSEQLEQTEHVPCGAPPLAGGCEHNVVAFTGGRKPLPEIKTTYAGRPTLLARVRDILRDEGPVKRKPIIDRLGVRQEDVQRAVNVLCERGYAERVGHGLYDLTRAARSQRWA
jgi:hypothetical protein